MPSNLITDMCIESREKSPIEWRMARDGKDQRGERCGQMLWLYCRLREDRQKNLTQSQQKEWGCGLERRSRKKMRG